MEWYKIFTKENLTTEFEGIIYTERWCPVNGFSNYEISDFGRVRSLITNKFIKQRKFQKGYMAIDLRRAENNKCTLYVHILVAKHFVSNPLNKPQVNHKKRVRNYNFFLGLEWMTNRENIQHGWDNRRNTGKGSA